MTPAIYKCIDSPPGPEVDGKKEPRVKSCGLTFPGEPGPTECPCGNLYVKWLNYEEMKKEWNAPSVEEE